MATCSFDRVFTVNEDWGIKNLEKCIKNGSMLARMTEEEKAQARKEFEVPEEVLKKFKERYNI